jgi:hypothetical protein
MLLLAVFAFLHPACGSREASTGTPDSDSGPPAVAPGGPDAAEADTDAGSVEFPCGTPDVGGWTTPIPTALVSTIPLTDLTQPGSRIHYVSSSRGDDATASIYFWDGKRLVDATGSPTDAAGEAYGSDPLQPSSAVKPFKRWAWVAPRRTPTDDIGSNAVPGFPAPGTRAGYPDWFLFHRGETVDLLEDARSFWQEENPSYTNDGSDLSTTLALSAGKSSTERKVMGAYGDLCLPRPRFIHPPGGFVSINASSGPPVKNIAYFSLHFDGHDRSKPGQYTGVTLLHQTPDSEDLWFEDLWVDGAPSNIQNEAEVTLRRCLVTDAFGDGGGNVEGLFYKGEGLKARLHIEETIFLRNGFRNADPEVFGWPPSGTNGWDPYDRNMYISGVVDPTASTFVDSISMLGTSGDQFRGGRKVERSFFYQGYVNMGGFNGAYAATPELSTGSFVDNVMQVFVSTGADDNRGHPGWGLTLGGGAQHVEVARNVFSAAAQQHNLAQSFAFVPSMTDCITGETYLRGPNEGNQVHDNVFDSADADAAIVIAEGVNNDPCYQWTFPSTTGNTISNNTIVNSNNRAWLYQPDATAAGTATDTVFTNNPVYPTRAAAAAARGWTAPDRTLKTYLESHGVTVTSPDGFPEYFKAATTMRKGAWDPRWTARPLVNHVRTGFGMTPL